MQPKPITIYHQALIDGEVTACDLGNGQWMLRDKDDGASTTMILTEGQLRAILRVTDSLLASSEPRLKFRPIKQVPIERHVNIMKQ